MLDMHEMKTARVLTVLRFLDIMKKIDGLWKKLPYAHSPISWFFTSSGLDRLTKETEERVTRVGSFKAVCCDYKIIFLFSRFILQPRRRQNNTKKKVLT